MNSQTDTVTPYHRELLDEDRYLRDKFFYKLGRELGPVPDSISIITNRDRQCYLMGKNYSEAISI